MAWSDSTVTNSGLILLNELLAGRTLTITQAIGGTGTVNPTELTSLDNLQIPKQELSLLGIENQEEGKRIKLQITSTGITEGYQLQQVAVYAALDKQEESKLLFVMQDDKGIWIPAESESPGFVVEMYAFIAMTNDVKIQMIATSGALASIGMLTEAIGIHNKDSEAHADIRAGVNLANTAVKRLLNSKIGIAQMDITIPVDGWEPDSVFPYHCDIADEQITADSIPMLTILPESATTARDSAIAPYAQTMDGVLRVYAETTPTEPVQMSVSLLGVPPSIDVDITGGVYDITVATPEEAQEMMQEVFEGTLPAGANIPIATQQDAQEMMDEVLGG